LRSQFSLDEQDLAREYTFPQLVMSYSYPSFSQQLESYRVTGEEYGESKLLHVMVNGTRVWTKFREGPMDLAEDNVEFPYCFNVLDQIDDPGVWMTNPATGIDSGCPTSIKPLRCSFLERYEFASGQWGKYNVAIWDNTFLQRQAALKNLSNTVFLIGVLFIMFTALSNDVTSLVVRPIESMVDIVQKLSQNPTLQLEGQNKSKYETEAVRVALAKIVGLMQLGFGGAGHEIISANLANSDSAQLDLMIRGRKKECAYGFCDIRQFTDTVECLQDQVMLFTNSVGEIIHQACHDNNGEPNKNIGDAFLIVWRPKG